MTDDYLLKVDDFCLVKSDLFDDDEQDKEVQVQWTECRDLTPDTKWTLSLVKETTIETDQRCLTNNEDQLVLTLCDASFNQTWAFAPIEPAY